MSTYVQWDDDRMLQLQTQLKRQEVQLRRHEDALMKLSGGNGDGSAMSTLEIQDGKNVESNDEAHTEQTKPLSCSGDQFSQIEDSYALEPSVRHHPAVNVTASFLIYC